MNEAFSDDNPDAVSLDDSFPDEPDEARPDPRAPRTEEARSWTGHQSRDGITASQVLDTPDGLDQFASEARVDVPDEEIDIPVIVPLQRQHSPVPGEFVKTPTNWLLFAAVAIASASITIALLLWLRPATGERQVAQIAADRGAPPSATPETARSYDADAQSSVGRTSSADTASAPVRSPARVESTLTPVPESTAAAAAPSSRAARPAVEPAAQRVPPARPFPESQARPVPAIGDSITTAPVAVPRAEEVVETVPTSPQPPSLSSANPPATTGAPPSASARVSPGPPATAAPPATRGPSAVELETRAVRQVLDRYRTAFNTLDAAAAKNAWPGVNERALARAFAGLEEQNLSFDSCQVEVVNRAVARAVCSGSVSYVPRVGSRTLRQDQREWSFTLRRDVNRWSIDSVDTR